MNITRRILVPVFGLLALAGSVSAPDAVAQSGNEPSSRQCLNACSALRINLATLNLSASQKRDVAQALDQYRTDVMEIRPERIAAGKVLFSAVHSPTKPFTEQPVIDAQINFANLDQQRVVRKARLFSELSDILNPRQYLKMVAADIQLFLCTEAPEAIFRSRIAAWIDANK